jgi:hypothetical protein
VMHFKMSLIPYEVSTDWIEPTLMKIKECLPREQTPEHSDSCEFGIFLNALDVI